MNRLLLLLLLLWSAAPLIAQTPNQVPCCGKVDRVNDFPSRYIPTRPVDIWLPEGYSPAKKYAVIFMQDGQNLFDFHITWNEQEWGVDETITQLQSEKKLRDCIVVGIWNAGHLRRRTEYFPQRAYDALTPEEKKRISYTAQSPNPQRIAPTGPDSDNYLKFLVEELKPYIDTQYSTLSDRSNTFIAGSSMGALVSLYALCEYPEVFGGAACLSTHWPGMGFSEKNPAPKVILDYVAKHLPDPAMHKVYFDHGTITLDAEYKPFQDHANALFKKKGYTSKNLVSRVFPGQDHSENAWQKRFSIPLLFLLGK